MHIFKHLLFTIILFFTVSVHSAPSDCIQLVEDGQVNCIKATSVFTTGSSATLPKFNTADELISHVVNNIICSSYIGAYECYAQYETQPIYPPPGRPLCSSNICNEFINYSRNQTQNGFRIIATVLNNTEPYYSTRHFQRVIIGYKLMSCPQNTTAIDLEGVTSPFIKWCKPTNIQFEPTPCNDGCNPGKGDSSY